MHLHTLSQMGTFHTQHNEDAYVVEELGRGLTLLAVLDGCSMGKESHFAATLVVKILRKIATTIGYTALVQQQLLSPDACLSTCIKQLFQTLQSLQSQLLLEKEELLTTLLLGILDVPQRCAEILVVGDGLVYHNGQEYVYDHDNRPDYLGYHLAEPFGKWYAAQTQRLSLSNIQSLSLCTDGIFSFQPFDNGHYPVITEQGVVHQLLGSQAPVNVDNWLWYHLRHLEHAYGLQPSDDCTILRVAL